MVRTNLADAQVVGLSAQGRYEFAYNAARLLATMVVRASGHRVIAKNGHHYYTFQAMEAADAAVFGPAAIYFDAARSKRNDFSYDAPVSVSNTEADDLLHEGTRFRLSVEKWIGAKDPALS